MAVAFNREPTWLFMNWIFESQTERDEKDWGVVGTVRMGFMLNTCSGKACIEWDNDYAYIQHLSTPRTAGTLHISPWGPEDNISHSGCVLVA